jgi:hypothetical protein
VAGWTPGPAKLAGAAVTGLFGAIVCTPPYAIARGGIYLLGSSTLFPLGVALLIIGLMLEAGATGAVKAIKVSAKLLADRSRDMPGDHVLLENTVRWVTCGSSGRQAAYVYSLIRPPRTGFRWICRVPMSVTVARAALPSSSGTRWAMP